MWYDIELLIQRFSLSGYLEIKTLMHGTNSIEKFFNQID